MPVERLLNASVKREAADPRTRRFPLPQAPPVCHPSSLLRTRRMRRTLGRDAALHKRTQKTAAPRNERHKTHRTAMAAYGAAAFPVAAEAGVVEVGGVAAEVGVVAAEAGVVSAEEDDAAQVAMAAKVAA